MTASLAAPPRPQPAAADRWICPFCPLLCEHLGLAAGAAGQPPLLRGGDCRRATQRLAGLWGPTGADATDAALARIDGRPVPLDEALQAAAAVLRASRQPLFGGLGTDVAGARALYRLAEATGAISDSAAGPALTETLRALQDRGGFSTTLAELRTRADLVVCLGGLFTGGAPLFIDRCLLPPRTAGRDLAPGAAAPPRQVVVLGSTPADAPALARLAAAPGIALQLLPLAGDLHDTVAVLAALVAQRAVPQPPAGLQALADALRAAQYAVLVGTPPALPAQGALVIEAVHRLVDQLNGHTRAAALWLGGGEGAATTNQVFAWLSGLPLRSRRGPAGLEHEPVAFDAQRLLADGAVDALLWVSSFDAALAPPATACPRIVFGPPALGAGLVAAGGQARPTVFIPVATPGVQIAGDLFRTDGTVLLPLVPLPLPNPPGAGLPALAAVLGRLGALLAAGGTP